MKNKKVYVVGGDFSYTRFLKNIDIVENLTDADIVLFTGGSDVDPSLYNCAKHPATYSDINRDLFEKEIFESVNPDQLCVGICRGLN